MLRQPEQLSSKKCKSSTGIDAENIRSSTISYRSGVFGVYGIAVDYRHLTIVADYMVKSL